MLTYKPVR